MTHLPDFSVWLGVPDHAVGRLKLWMRTTVATNVVICVVWFAAYLMVCTPKGYAR